MSEIKVNKISPATGTDITLGDSGDTLTVPSGGTIVNSGTATGFGGGAWNKIHAQTVTGTPATVIFDDTTASEWFSADYKVYKLLISGLEPNITSGQWELYLEFEHAGSYVTSGYNWAVQSIKDNVTTYSQRASASDSNIQLTYDNIGGQAGAHSHWELTFDDPLGTSNWKTVYGHGAMVDHDSKNRLDVCTGGSATATAMTGFKFYLESSATFRAGTFTLYGITP